MIVYRGLYADRPAKPQVEDVYEATDTEQYLVCFTAGTWKDITGTALHKAISGEIAAMTEKVTPVNADLVVIEDSADSNNKKKAQVGNLPGGGEGDTHPVADTTELVKGSADATKKVRIEADGLTTGTTRVITMPDKDVTIDDDGDSRPPSGAAGGDLGGTYPNPTVDDGADGTAIHDDVAGEINALTEKITPVNADLIIIEDSAASNAKKKAQIGNLPGGGGGVDKGCRIKRGSNQSISNSSWTAINYDQEDYDTDGMHDNATNNERITIKTAGKYLIGGMVRFDINSTGVRGVRFWKNGSTQIGNLQLISHGTLYWVTTAHLIANFAVNDYVEIQVWQNSGGSLNLIYIANQENTAWAQKIDKGG